MSARLSLVDLNCNLIFLQYGNISEIEYLKELLDKEFPEDEITMDELVEWQQLMYEVASLEIQQAWYYEEVGVPIERID